MRNQFLNSESIFEVIGNYPVVDQFDVLYTNLQSGSYVDRYITGSMFVATIGTPTGRGGFTYSTPASRGRAFSKLGVDAAKLPTQNIDDTNRSYNLQPWRERAGTVKNLKVFSNSERFYDSLLPDFSKMILELGGAITGTVNSAYGIRGSILNLGPLATGRVIGYRMMFPFEPTFSNVPRQRFFSKGIKSTTGDEVEGNLLLSFGSEHQSALNFASTTVYANPALNPPIIISPGTEYNGNYVVAYSPDYTVGVTPINYAAKNSDLIKVLFGFGDFNSRAVNFPDSVVANQGYTQCPFYRSGSINGLVGNSRLCGPIIRGWKYGVQDGNPHYTSCVFRRDRFGQLRDMLEQRLYPVSYLDYENAPTRFFGDFETSATPNPSPERVKNATIEYPLTVTFVKQQVVTLGPSNSPTEFLVSVENRFRNETWSSNLSSYATSSLPYFDLENSSLGRNRNEIPNSVINPEAVYITTD